MPGSPDTLSSPLVIYAHVPSRTHLLGTEITSISFFFLIKILLIFRAREEGRERGRETPMYKRNIYLLIASRIPLAGDLPARTCQ